jgi:hypothetical protein
MRCGMQRCAVVEVRPNGSSTQPSCCCMVHVVPEAKKAWQVAELHMALACSSMQQLCVVRIILNAASQLQQRVIAGMI